MNILDFLTPKYETHFYLSTITLRQAFEKFTIHKYSVMPLIDSEGKYVTTISASDLLEASRVPRMTLKASEKIKVGDIIVSRPYQSLTIDSTIEQVYDLLLDQSFIPMVDSNGIYMGIIKRKTFLRAFKNKILS